MNTDFADKLFGTRPHGPYVGRGRSHYVFTTTSSSLLGLPGYNMLYSVEVSETATGTLKLYNGVDATGDMIASIDISAKGSYRFGGVYCPRGLYVEVDTGGTSASLSIVCDAANPKTVTVSGNEITDAVRNSAPLWGTARSTDMVDGLAAPAGYGIYRAATNLFRYGQCDATTDWLGTSDATIAVDSSVAAPFSSQSVKITTSGSTTGHAGSVATSATGQAAAAGTVGVGSIWFKGVSGNSYVHWLQWTQTDSSAAGGTTTLFTATGGWQLLSPLSVAVGSGKTGDSLRIRVETNTLRAESFWVAHAMLESGQGVVAPYVATTGGSTATHSLGRVQAPSSVLGAGQGWWAARIKMGYSNTSGAALGFSPRIAAWMNDANNRLLMVYDSSNARFVLESQVGGGSFAIAGSAGVTFNAGDVFTVIGAWDGSNVKISQGGVAFVSVSSSGSWPTLTAPKFDIGSDGANQIGSSMLLFATGKGTLSDSDAAAINSDTDWTFNSFPDAAQTSMIWPCMSTDYFTPF
jgi:hypothetical protein